MKEYHKIYNLYKRDGSGKLIEGNYVLHEFEYLSNCQWDFYEKVDGTNIRIMWNGSNVRIGGKSNNAQIPCDLLEILTDKFCNPTSLKLFNEKFGEKSVCLYGEGYGAGIQKVGIKYNSKNKMFILFDILIDDYWLEKSNVFDIASIFSISHAPLKLTGKFTDAIDFLKKECKSTLGDCEIEGLIGIPKLTLLTKNKERMIVKIKTKDIRNSFLDL